MSPKQAAFYFASMRNIIVRNRVGQWKHPQGIALMSLTARSADFFYFIVKYISVMNYKKMKERMERKEESVKKLIEFLAREYSYTEIMTEMAIAQTTIMELTEIATIHGYKKCTEDVTSFLVAVQCLMITLQDLSDFAQMEKEDE